MEEKHYKNSLTGTPIFDKPKLGFNRKYIYDADNNIIGSVSRNKIFDLNDRMWGRIVTRNEDSGFNKNEIVDRGQVIATIDEKHNIYKKELMYGRTGSIPSVYVGTIKINKFKVIILPLLIALISMTAVTAVVMALLFKNTTDIPNRAPVINVISTVGERDWVNYKKINVFGSTGIIAPDDKGYYEFRIKNDETYRITYWLDFVEDNTHNFSLVYRLATRDGRLIDGYTSWTTAPLLGDNYSAVLNPGESQTLRLYWWWDPNVSDEADTENGENRNKYLITINVNSQFTDQK